MIRRLAAQSSTVCLSLLLIAIAGQAGSVAAADPVSEKVFPLIKRWNRPDHPGCIVAVVYRGQLVYRQAVGSANLDYRAPITTETTFQVGSLSKSFTTACLAIAIDKKLVSPGQDIRKYLPELQTFDPPITVRDLARCHSGLWDYLNLMELAGWPQEPSWVGYNEDDVLSLLAGQRLPLVPPGSVFRYSNSDYFLLAKIIERTSGQTIREFANENLFEPLEMTRTQYADQSHQPAFKRAIGYEQRQAGWEAWNSSGDVMGASGVTTCMDDMIRWDANFNRNRLRKGKLLNQFIEEGGLFGNQFCLSVAAAIKQQQTPTSDDPIGRYRGARRIEFTGGGWGYAAAMIRFPEHRLTVMCLTNNAGEIVPWDLCHEIADELLQDRLQSAESRPPTDVDHGKTVKLSQRQLLRLTGTYRDPNGRVWVVALKNGELSYTNGRQETFVLAPTEHDHFVPVDSPYSGDWFSFERMGTKRELKLRLHWSGGVIDFERVELPKYTLSQLQRFTGIYDSQELATTYRFRLEDGRLQLRINSGRWEPLMATGPNEFQPELHHQYDLRIIQFEPGQNDFQSLVIGSGRVQGIRFTKRPGRPGL